MPTRPSRSHQQEKTRKTRKRAVLQFRIPEAEYRELAKTAAKSDLTISEEAARRLLAYSMMEREADVQEDAVEIELERRVYRKLMLRLRPSVLGASLSHLTSLQIEELLVKAARMGAELALKDLQK
jgi:hypothetical protein